MTQKLWYGINALLISIITLYLFGINKIGFFINSQYYWWLLVSSLSVFVAVLIYIWYTTRAHKTGKKAGYSHLIFGSLLFVILLSLFIVPLKPLGSESAGYAKRANIKKDNQKTQYVAKTPEAISSLSLIDWVNILSKTANPSQYNGQKVIIKGFVSSTNPQGFDLSTYQVSCCVVDAQIYSLPIKSANIPAKDTWLNVQGQFEITGQKPNIVYSLISSSYEATPIPSDPYQAK
jgi:putative membrane protein